jgi:hypothetical protein
MLSAAPDDRKTLALKALAAAGIVLYGLQIAKSVSGSTGPAGFHLPIGAIVLVCAPPALIAMLRMPIIFPFGLYVALLPFDPLLSVSSGATLVRLLGILTVVALVVQMLLTRRMMPLRAPWYCWLAFIVWGATSMLWSVEFEHGKQIYGIFLQNFALMSILAVYPLTKRDFNAVVALMIGGGVVSVLYAIGPSGLGGGTTRISIASSGGNVVDQNFFATSFMLPVAFAFAAAISGKRLWLRAVYFAAAAAMMLGVLVSGSRGGFIALVLMMVYFAVRSRSLVQVGLLFAAFVGLLIRYPLVWLRFLHDDGGGTGSGRTDIWHVGLQALHGHWLFGTGVGTFQESYARVYLLAYQHSGQGWTRPAHNVFLGMAVELGIVGLALMVYAWYRSFRSLRVIPRGSPNFALRTACEAGMLALMVQSLFIDAMWIKFFWLGFSLPFMLLNVESVRVAAARRVQAFAQVVSAPARAS